MAAMPPEDTPCFATAPCAIEPIEVVADGFSGLVPPLAEPEPKPVMLAGRERPAIVVVPTWEGAEPEVEGLPDGWLDPLVLMTLLGLAPTSTAGEDSVVVPLVPPPMPPKVPVGVVP